MRTRYRSVSSARRLSSWLMVLLGLAGYVGLIYALTLVPLQLEVPLPDWGGAVVPAVTYGLLLWAWVRRPSVLRWIVGTALLSGIHELLGMSREPLSALLDPALAGRPLPWMLPPPLPELIGVMLLLVPFRDVLRVPVRPARERGATVGRPAAISRARSAAAPRVQPTPAAEGSGSLSEALLARAEPTPGPARPVPPMAPPPAPPPPPPAPEEEPRRPRAAARAERRRELEPPRPRRRSDVVLRIGLDRVMGQLPPGTFLAPEDEVAASLRDPGHLLISGELVVTQLAEGVARVAWADIADQFPPHLVGLSESEISGHLGDGLRLPLDEVIGQFPHELFVADTPEVKMPGFDRIPVPFRQLEELEPAPSSSSVSEPAIQPGTEALPWHPIMTAPAVEPPPPVVAGSPAGAPPVPPPSAEASAAVPVVPPPAYADVEPSPPEPVEQPESPPIGSPPVGPATDEPTVRISFSRVAGELPPEGFHVPLEQVAERMWQPGSLLIPQSVVLPQLSEGLIRVGWDVIATQFPRGEMAVSDAEMADRLPNGIRLPLDEVIRQVPLDLFMAGGPAADVRGLESFPAPFQPLLSDPAPEPPPRVTEPAEASVPVPEREPVVIVPDEPQEIGGPAVDPAPGLIVPPAPEAIAVPDPMVDAAPTQAEAVPVIEMVEPDLPHVVETDVATGDPAPEVGPRDRAAVRACEPPAPDASRAEAVQGAAVWPEEPSAPIAAASLPGPAEAAEARRIVAMLAPIASFDVSVQVVEDATVFAMASPTVAQETAVAVAGLALPLLDRHLPRRVDQITLRGPETALVLTPLGGPGERGPVLAVAAPRDGSLALLEIFCRRAARDRAQRPTSRGPDARAAASHGLVPVPVPSRAAGLTASLTAFGRVTASVLRDAESEAVLYFFLPAGDDVPEVGAFAQDLQAVMRKASGSGAVFRTAILRSGDTILVIQPEEIGHGRSIVIVAGGPVTRPGLAYRQVERAATTLMSA